MLSPEKPKLYFQLADWFHLLTAPSSYVEEAGFVRETLVKFSASPVASVLELGSGGGNNAFHLKAHFEMTLTDISTAMLDQSRRINPDCEHTAGDMRSLRLGRHFDAVLIHDAICHLTCAEDVADCLRTAFVHCKPGGAVLVMPDYVRERFRSGVHHGGHDGDGRSLRYFEWTFDPDASDTTYTVDFAYMLRERNEPVRVEHETHLMGLFSRDEWLLWLRRAGFDPQVLEDPYERAVFIGVR